MQDPETFFFLAVQLAPAGCQSWLHKSSTINVFTNYTDNFLISDCSEPLNCRAYHSELNTCSRKVSGLCCIPDLGELNWFLNALPFLILKAVRCSRRSTVWWFTLVGLHLLSKMVRERPASAVSLTCMILERPCSWSSCSCLRFIHKYFNQVTQNFTKLNLFPYYLFYGI